MVKRIWRNDAYNTQNFTWWNGETQWWNGATINIFIYLCLNGVANIVKLCIEYTQVHMVKWWNKVVGIYYSQNGEMAKWEKDETVILTSISTIFHGNLQQWVPRLPIDSIRCYIRSLCISRLWVVPHWSPNCPTCHSKALWCRTHPHFFWLIHLYFPFLMTPKKWGDHTI